MGGSSSQTRQPTLPTALSTLARWIRCFSGKEKGKGNRRRLAIRPVYRMHTSAHAHTRACTHARTHARIGISHGVSLLSLRLFICAFIDVHLIGLKPCTLYLTATCCDNTHR